MNSKTVFTPHRRRDICKHTSEAGPPAPRSMRLFHKIKKDRLSHDNRSIFNLKSNTMKNTVQI